MTTPLNPIADRLYLPYSLVPNGIPSITLGDAPIERSQSETGVETRSLSLGAVNSVGADAENLTGILPTIHFGLTIVANFEHICSEDLATLYEFWFESYSYRPFLIPQSHPLWACIPAKETLWRLAHENWRLGEAPPQITPSRSHWGDFSLTFVNLLGDYQSL
jgi:hypothetical protein